MTVCTLKTHPSFPHPFTFTRRHPRFTDVMGLSLADALIRGLDTSTELEPCTKRQRTMLLDVKETKETLEVRADIPGVRKEDIHVDIDKNVLTLSVHQEDQKQDEVTKEPNTGKENGKEDNISEEGKDKKAAEPAATAADAEGTCWHCSERSGVFTQRSIRLPQTADAFAAKASYTDGVLTITFPKKSPVDTSVKISIN